MPPWETLGFGCRTWSMILEMNSCCVNWDSASARSAPLAEKNAMRCGAWAGSGGASWLKGSPEPGVGGGSVLDIG